ncbi:putative hydrolase YxeP [compost metagenome]
MKQAIMTWLNRHKDEMESTFRELHSLAEVSWEEKRTTAYLRKALEGIQVPNLTFEEHTGIVAEWQGAGMRTTTVAIRADMDALMQHVGGVWKANHSCGHDAHMTMVFYALKCLKEIGFRPSGKLIVLFQPAEETGEGARKLLQLGLLDDVEYLLGIHLRPAKELGFGAASSAIYHGAAATLLGKVKGRQSHAARPNEGINVIDSLAAIVQATNAVQSDPTVPSSCKVTRMSVANTSSNIIPDAGEFTIDVRAQTNDVMDDLLGKLKQAVTMAGAANCAEVELELGMRTVAAVPNGMMEAIVGGAIEEILGEDVLASPPVTPGGEDFHFYSHDKPGIRATMIGLGADLVPGLHHPEMQFQLEALQIGSAILANSVVKLFANGQEM